MSALVDPNQTEAEISYLLAVYGFNRFQVATSEPTYLIAFFDGLRGVKKSSTSA